MFSILNGGRTMVKTSQNQPVKKKRNTRGMGSIRQKNGGYKGRITIKVNGKSKQISLFNKDKRILVQEMIKAKQEANDNEYVEKDKITLEEWLKKWNIPYDEILFGKPWPGHKGLYIDDRAVRPDEFLEHSFDELEEICKNSSRKHK